MRLKRFLQGFGLLAVILTLIPLIAADFWWIRIFDYPHIELTILTLTAIAAYFIRFDIKHYQDYVFMVVLIGCFIYQFLKIAPYTPLAPYEVNNSEKTNKSDRLDILTANVLQKNKKKDKLIAIVDKLDADIMVFTETDKKWQQAIDKAFGAEYPYTASAPIDNTYGMLVYSRYKLDNPKVRYIVDDSIPSVHSDVILPSGKKIRLHAIHPTPPMPQENPSSTDRDAELMKVAKMVKDSDLPVVVIGDFNDVAWSATTRLFKQVGELLDVRVGRSFYNTFDAKNPIMRWPLDHVFVSEEFRLNDIKTGDHTGSDHFPFYASLSLEPEKAQAQKPDKATKDQLETANEQIKDEKEEELKKKK